MPIFDHPVSIPAANWRPKWGVQAPFEESRDCTHGNMVAESACHTNAEIIYIYIMLKVSLKWWNSLYFQIVPEWLVDCWLECAMWQSICSKDLCMSTSDFVPSLKLSYSYFVELRLPGTTKHLIAFHIPLSTILKHVNSHHLKGLKNTHSLHPAVFQIDRLSSSINHRRNPPWPRNMRVRSIHGRQQFPPVRFGFGDGETQRCSTSISHNAIGPELVAICCLNL